MNRIASFITAVVFSVATMAFAIPAVAQVQETPATGQTVRGTEINMRFAAAGIKIAFPQRDVHIQSGSESAPLLDSPKSSTVRRQL